MSCLNSKIVFTIQENNIDIDINVFFIAYFRKICYDKMRFILQQRKFGLIVYFLFLLLLTFSANLLAKI